MGFAILATFVLAVVVGLGWLSWYVYRHIPTAEDIRRRWDAGRRLWWGLGRRRGSDDGGRCCGEAGACEAGGAGGAFEVRYVARPLPEIPPPPSPSLSSENLVDFGEYIEDYFGPRSNPSSESDYQDDFHPLDNSVNQPSHLEQDDFDYLNQRLIDTDRRLDTMGRLLEENRNHLIDLREGEREAEIPMDVDLDLNLDPLFKLEDELFQIGRDMYNLMHDLTSEPYPVMLRNQGDRNQGGHQGGGLVGGQAGGHLGGQVGGHQGRPVVPQPQGGHQGGQVGGLLGGQAGMPQNQVNNLRRSTRVPKPNKHPDFHYF